MGGDLISVVELWEKRYRAPVVMWSSVASHAPERGLVVTNPDGIYQLYAWDVGTEGLRPVTSVPQGILVGLISPDGRYVYYHSDAEGNEIGHWVRVPFEGGTPQNLTPELPPYPLAPLSVSGDSSRIGLTRPTSDGFIVELVDDVDGQLEWPREIFRSTALSFGPLLSEDGALAAVLTNERSSGGFEFSLVAVDAATGRRVAELWDGSESSIEYGRFSPISGDDRILGKSDASGTNRPFVWSPRSGERVDLVMDELEGDISPLDWSPDGRYILLGQIHQARQHLHVYDLESESHRALPSRPGTWGWGSAMVAYFAQGGEIFAHWQDATHPAALIALDPSGNASRTLLPAGEVPASRPWRSISFSSDGQEIQGWLCEPEGQGPFPTILHTHGGPTSATMEVFSAACQAFVDRGFAFCTINYHGSTTFGRTFQESIIGAPGRREVADMVAARDWLVEQGVANPDRIMLTGSSYGGYLTLLALGLHPDLWAGGMAGVPVTDWAMLFEDAADTLRAYAASLFKGAPEERPEQYVASSPLAYVDRVKAPVLILFGRNDSRCPARQVDEYIRRLKEGGKHVQVHEFQGGHMSAFSDTGEAIKEQRIMLDFATRVVQGGVASPSPA